MLQSLRIQNLALIDDAQIHFGEGLTVFTGESGSGKSTVLDALALLRGAARPRIQIRKASKSGLVEAEFRLLRDKNGGILNQALCGALDEAGLLSAIDLGEPLVLARRIEATGRTRSFIQGQTVTRTVLAAVASELLDLTGQAEAHRLRTTGAQLLALDQYGGLLGARAEVDDAVQLLRDQEAELEEVTHQLSEAQSRQDFLNFQIEELSCCDLNKLDERRARLCQLEETESVSVAFQEVLSGLKFGADPLLGRLEVIARQLPNDTKESGGAGDVTCDIESAIELLERACIVAEEIVSEGQSDGEERADLKKSLRAIDALAQKYRIDIEDLPRKTQALLDEKLRAEEAELRHSALMHAVTRSRAHAESLAESLHTARLGASKRLVRRLKKELQSVGLAGAVIEAHLCRGPLTQSGISHLDLGFSANPGHPPAPLARVASGGELGRVLLGFRLATDTPGSLLSFDEIDAGSGGRTAELIAAALRRASERSQILCVTHWPQVAAVADHHFSFQKLSEGSRTWVNIRAVKGEARVDELTRMLGGPEDGARGLASELVKVPASAA